MGGAQPPGYAFPGMVYDTLTKKAIQFGGESGSEILQNQTWAYNIPTRTWTQKALSTVPPGPSGLEGMPAIAYNPNTNKILYHETSGSSAPSDWQYDPGWQTPGVS